MIVRQLEAEKFDRFQAQLFEKAQQNPLEASFSVRITVNQTEYLLKLQPEKGHKLVALQALKVEREDYGHLHELIMDNKILSSLLELLLWQGVAS